MAVDSASVTRPFRQATRIALAAGICIIFLTANGAEPQTLAPSRIVSIIPAVTEILFAIGAGAQVVGVGSYDRYPTEVAQLPRIGGLIDPDIERIISLRSDLVIAYATQLDLLEQLARAEIPVFRYEHGTLADILDTIRALGKRTGNAAQAERVAVRIERELAEIRRRVAGLEHPRTILVFAREPNSLRNVFASGGIGFQHDMLEVAGGRNVFANIRRRTVQATTESILAAAPDVVLEVRYGGDMSDEQIARERDVWNTLPALPAVRHRRVRFLVGDDLVIPGPRVAEATARLERALHPERFEPD